MKRLLAISVIVGFLCFFTDGAKAESNFFSVSKTIISETTDMSKKNTIELSATNADPNICSITLTLQMETRRLSRSKEMNV